MSTRSLPVSDPTTVLSTASIPLVVLPLLLFAIIVTAQMVMAALSTAVLLGNRPSLATLWAWLPLLKMSLALLYALTAIALWQAPIYGWLLLVCGWTRRAPFLWAVLPPLAVCVFEKIAFDTSYLASLLRYRLIGSFTQAFVFQAWGSAPIDPLTHLTPGRFLSTPGLWVGLGAAAIFVAAAFVQPFARGGHSMSAAVMVERMAEASPGLKARMAGGFWLLCALTGTVAMLAGGTLGIVANLAATLSYIAATLLVYALLKPVNGSLSLLAALCSVAGCGIGVLNMFLGLGVPAYNITFLFGVHCFLVGYLILRSTFLPRFVGALMTLAGLGWLTKSVASLLSLPLGRSPYILAPGILGEVSLALWLLVIGVNAQRWSEQARAAGERRP